jgi:GMP reductase
MKAFFYNEKEQVQLDYSDVLIAPKPSTVGSRSSVDLSRVLNFPKEGVTFHGTPILAANMDTVGTPRMAVALQKFGIFSCLSKTTTNQEIQEMLLRDETGGLINLIAPSIGITKADLEKFRELYREVKVKFVCIDVANGYMKNFLFFVSDFKKEFPNVVVIAGNVATKEGTNALIEAGANIIKVGIGPGSACLTRTKTGVGVPQLSAVWECAEAARESGKSVYIAADGGCTSPGDVAKAFVAGASFVMLGGMLSGHSECGSNTVTIDGKEYMEFYGMSSEKANEKHFGGLKNYRTSEGRELLVPNKGPVENTVQDILGGIRSTCAYVNATNLEQLYQNGQFVRVNNQINNFLARTGIDGAG